MLFLLSLSAVWSLGRHLVGAKTDLRDVYALNQLRKEILSTPALQTPQWMGVLASWEATEGRGIDPCGSLEGGSGKRSSTFSANNNTEWEGIDCRYQAWMPLEVSPSYR